VHNPQRIGRSEFNSLAVDHQMIALVFFQSLNTKPWARAVDNKERSIRSLGEVLIERNSGTQRKIPRKPFQSAMNTLVSTAKFDSRLMVESQKTILPRDL